MISRIEGELIGVSDGKAELRCDAVTYELLVPAADEATLTERLGERASFFTMHFLEIQGQGASYVPRLIGFASPHDRAFFQLFTTVKGIGTRKALRALQLPFAQVARAIALKDVDVLVSLPEIGKRTAETIVAELHGKIDRFVEVKPVGASVGGDGAVGSGRPAWLTDAVAVLTQLGEPAGQARQLVERALAADPTIDSPDALIEAAFRLKELP